MVKKMFIEIRLCNPTTYDFKGHVKIVEIRLTIMVFFVNAQYIHKYNAILNKTVTKLSAILTKCFFSISEPYKLP